MYLTRLILAALAIFTYGNSLKAEHFTYGDTKPAGRNDEQFLGQQCRISVYGPSGGSYVKGNYDEPDGILKITVDRLSYLEVAGRAKKVVIVFVDLNSNVNLANLDIGLGGVEIHSVNRRSKVDIGHCKGPITIKSVETSVLTVHPGTTVTGHDRLTDGSALFFENLSAVSEAD